MLGFLRGLGQVRVYSLAGITIAILALATVVIGAALGGFRGAFLGAVAAQALGAAVLGFAAVANAPPRPRSFGILTSEAAMLERRLIVLGSLALAAALAGGLGQSLSRSYLANSLDHRALGFFAAAWSITNRLPALLYQTFSTHTVPTISALGRDWRRISEEQNNALRLSLLVATPVLAMAIVGAPLLIRILLSNEFLPMSDLLRVMLFGELLSIIYWTTGIALYPSGRPLASAVCEWTWWLIFGVDLVVLTHIAGLLGVGYAYAASYAVMAAVVYAAEKRHNRLEWTNANMRLIIISTILLSLVTILSAALDASTIISVILLFVILMAWPFVGLSTKERRQLRATFRRNLKI
jgi:O-antigen/teichoic acid export membrane protein